MLFKQQRCRITGVFPFNRELSCFRLGETLGCSNSTSLSRLKSCMYCTSSRIQSVGYHNYQGPTSTQHNPHIPSPLAEDGFQMSSLNGQTVMREPLIGSAFIGEPTRRPVGDSEHGSRSGSQGPRTSTLPLYAQAV